MSSYTDSMSTVELLLIAALVLLITVVILLGALMAHGRDPLASLRGFLDTLHADGERIERAMREEQRAGRSELSHSLAQLRDGMQAQFTQLAAQQHQRTEDFGQRLDQFTERTETRLEALRAALSEDARKTREESAATSKRFGEVLELRLSQLTQNSEARLAEIRATLENRLIELREDNTKQLDAMRATVDEKLHATLETRLGESFKLVSERLEQVHRGLGEMQNLAAGVGDLKRVLGNVKTRGVFGEVQLGALLEQLLTPEQYAGNVATVKNSNERVEYAIRLPGLRGDVPVWLPIDAKFPREDYERLLDAQERADADAATAAALALERRVREEAKRIRDKYVAPPHTTDFAILFLPTEGLYAEVLRRPGLFESLQRECRVTLAGPTTLTALLNSLQMGFRTLAIEKRSSEVWVLLGAVKTEFSKFAGVLERTRSQLDSVRNSIDQAGVRTRAIERKLRGVESLPSEQTSTLFGDEGTMPERGG